MQLVKVVLVVYISTAVSYTTPSPCTISSTWRDQYNNDCTAYRTKAWCVSED